MDLRKVKNLPLGLSINNPGNLRDSGIAWKGKVGSYKGFVVFESLEYGIRATLKNLDTYRKNGFDTVNEIVSRYAPPNENDTNNYKNYVVKHTGYTLNQVLSNADMPKLVSVMFSMEQGQIASNYVPISLIQTVHSNMEGLFTSTDSTGKKKYNFLAFGLLLVSLVGGGLALLTKPKGTMDKTAKNKKYAGWALLLVFPIYAGYTWYKNRPKK